jgi:2,3-diaminopropionate biosynthesis protein SbnA
MERTAVAGRAEIWENIGNTPTRTIRLLIGRRWREVILKLESYNPGGSSKDRTAAALLTTLSEQGLLTSGHVVVESTSGNLGVSLARLCRKLGIEFLAVIDPKTTDENRARMESLGARIELVEERDQTGGYLFSRLKRVREICANSSRYLWTDQYRNPANPAAHYSTTAREIFDQAGFPTDAILVPVSTGGTLAGISRFCRETSPRTCVIGVDAFGSVVFGQPPAARKLTGIGSSQPSSFLTCDSCDKRVIVRDSEAFAACRALDRALGLRLGGSGGAALFACGQLLQQYPDWATVVCFCPDSGWNYESSIFSDHWMNANGFDPDALPAPIEAFGGPSPDHEGS